jgi:hypothetical protein
MRASRIAAGRSIPSGAPIRRAGWTGRGPTCGARSPSSTTVRSRSSSRRGGRSIERIGGFNPALGRKGRSLLGQEQAEFFSRSREAGAIGRYVPAMAVHHHVPPARLTKQYYRRWWYWKGVARARMDALHPITELGVDLRVVPRIAGVPRYLFTDLPRLVAGWIGAAARGRWTDAARHQMHLCYSAGYIRACWARRRSPLSTHAADEPGLLASSLRLQP